MMMMIKKVLSFDLILPFNEWMMMFNFIYFQKGI